MNILVTGGCGYIGSHTVLELLEAGHDVQVVDNLANSSPVALQRVCELAGREAPLHRLDLRDTPELERLLAGQEFDAVIHFAALKAVGESVERPLDYYDNNVAGTISLCKAMVKTGLRNLVFSSSCSVHGTPRKIPVTEDHPLGAESPYGRTKQMMEQVFMDICQADPTWNAILLRYFNPVGAHASGRIGEDPRGVPDNLMPYITQVAVGRLPALRVFGNDYPTRDGTGVRDYIHVVDLARGHLQALARLADRTGLEVYNLGTGRGVSVLELVAAFEKATGRTIPYRLTARRPGDVAEVWADPAKAERVLGFKARLGIEDMCRDAWNWQQKNPEGYEYIGD